MNLQQKRILYRLWTVRKMVGEALPYVRRQINEFAQTPLPHEWRGHIDKLQWPELEKTDPGVFKHEPFTVYEQAAVNYLTQSGFIEVHTGPLGNMRDISVTASGEDLARKLATRRGRMGLWYREHKDGLFGILITIVVAAITALVTSWIKGS